MNRKGSVFFDLTLAFIFATLFVCGGLFVFVPAFESFLGSMFRALEQLIQFLRVIVPMLIFAGIIWLFGRIYASVIRAKNESRQIHPTEGGLYPLVDVDGKVVNFNDTRVQLMYAWSRAQALESLKPTASASQKVTEALQSGNWEIWKKEPEALEAPKEIECLTAYEASSKKPEPTIGIGMDEKGSLLEIGLEDRSNFLIGGLPGSGKSNLLAAMMVWIAKQDPTGKQVQIAVLDPKRVDYAAVPDNSALMALPKALTIESCQSSIAIIRQEVDRRNTVLAESGAKNLAQYNSFSQKKIPYLVTFVDEMAFFSKDKEFYDHVRKISSMGRASGVILVMATQRPSASVFDQTVKAMSEIAIAFRVGSQVDSRIILDRAGAEELPPIKGRCLVYDGECREVQALNALTKTRFDSYMKALPKKQDSYVDATYKDVSPEPEVFDATFWDEYCRNYISQYPEANTTQLAKAMASRRADGRDFETFRSTAYGYLKKYSNNYG